MYVHEWEPGLLISNMKPLIPDHDSCVRRPGLTRSLKQLQAQTPQSNAYSEPAKSFDEIEIQNCGATVRRHQYMANRFV